MAPFACRMATLRLYSCVSAVVEVTALLLIKNLRNDDADANENIARNTSY